MIGVISGILVKCQGKLKVGCSSLDMDHVVLRMVSQSASFEEQHRTTMIVFLAD